MAKSQLTGIFCMLLFLKAFALGDEHNAKAPVQTWLNQHCLDCHDDDIQKGDRRFDQINTQYPWNSSDAEQWLDILHQLQHEDMPPPKKSKLIDRERQAWIAWIQKGLHASAQQVQLNTSHLSQRLSNREIHFRLKDFFDWPSINFDPTDNLPRETIDHGFDNHMKYLTISPHWAEQMLNTAKRAVEHTWDLLGLESKRTFETRYKLTAQNQKNDVGPRFGVRGKNKKVYYISESLRNYNSSYYAKLFMGVKTLPHSGYYEIEVKANAANRFHPYGKGLMDAMGKHKHSYPELFYNKEQAMVLAVGSGSRAGRGHEPPTKLTSVTLEDNHEKVYRLHFWANQGDHIYFYFENGPSFPGTKSQFMSWVSHQYHPEIKPMNPKERGNLDVRAIRNKKVWEYYQGPEIQISEAELRGPFPFNHTLGVQSKLFGIIPAYTKQPDTSLIEKSITKLSQDLFQTTVSKAKLEPYITLLRQKLDMGLNYAQALKPVLITMLCSPEFIFHKQNAEKKEKVAAFAWQSRADSMPENKDPEIQLELVLTHPKHRRMLNSFISQWLNLNTLGSMPPDYKTHPLYYIENLDFAMKQETLLFFQHLYDENLPVTNIIDSDYSFINRGLSYLYDTKRLNSSEFVKISLKAQEHRRGLVSHGSILSLTSNGIETSPVKRGIWVLETLMGAPPSPPPPDIPALEPDIRGTKTVLELLEKHRQLKSCATCHDKIDPLGLSLENFDPIGAFRKQYPNGHNIINTAPYKKEKLQGFEGLQKLLRANSDFIAKNLLQQGMSFALRRELTWKDEAEMEQLFQKWKNQGLKFRDMFKFIIKSRLFTAEAKVISN